MQPNENKTIKIQTSEKEDFERREKAKKDHRGLPRIGVDFRKIEEMPETAFEKEVQRKISVQPEALAELVHDEQLKILKEAIKKAKLSTLEANCLKLYLKGYKSWRIVKKLKMGSAITARRILQNARQKLIRYVRRRFPDHLGR